MTDTKKYNSVIDAIGNTPIVRLNRVIKGCQANVFAKLEFMNPGGSIKDRIGYWLIEDAERKGLLKPGGVVVEGTSGNTGVGLAIAAAIKGYKCIFVLPDKMSNEKIRALRAFGAKVVVTPTAVEPEDPRSYYQVARRLAKETPHSVYVNQYDNLANRECHYQTTGPEILRQMPEIDVFVAGIGTGGTVCGVGRFLKEKKPACQVVAVDPIGSIVYDKFKHGKDVPARTYKIEGIGEDFFPKNYDFKVIDDMIQVEDQESFLMTRELLTREGIYSGISSGSAVVGALKWIREQGDRMKGKNVLVILPDSGNRYLSKVYDDDWMREAGFLDRAPLGSIEDLLHSLQIKPGTVIMTRQNDKVSTVIETMRERGISQVPVTDDRGWIKGVVSEGTVLSAIYEGRVKPSDPVGSLVDSSIEFICIDEPLDRVHKAIMGGKVPLITDPSGGKKDGSGPILGIVTKIDLLSYLGNRP